jgi:hypothetical protein
VLRRLLPLFPMPFVFALGAWTSARAAERAGADAAIALSAVAVLARAGQVTSASEPEAPTELTVIPAQYAVVAEPAAPPAKGRNGAKKARPSATPVVFVSQKAVLGLANSGAHPRGIFVPANAARPAGLRLTGVGALGIGMQDGDVLTRALGQPVTATGAVIQAVLVARAHHAAVLEGEFWRGAQRYVIRVEQPYVESDAPKQ